MKNHGLFKNTAHFTGALIIQKILSFGFFWFVSNQLLKEELGQYVFALSVTSLFAIFIDLGISAILVREASKDTAQANRYLKNVLALKLPLAVVAWVALMIFTVITVPSGTVKLLIVIASGIMVIDAFTTSLWAIFRALRNMYYESTSIILIQIIIAFFGCLVLLMFKHTVFLMLVLLFASGFNFFYALYLIKTRLHYSVKPVWEPGVVKHFAKLIPAFALGGIFGKIYLTSDTVLLGLLAGNAAVGLYSIPAKVTTAMSQVIPAAFAAAVFPVFSQLHHESNDRLKVLFIKSFKYLIIISLPLAGGIAVLSRQVLQIFWPKYIEISQTFGLMSLALPFIFLGFLTGYFLNACDQQRANTMNRGIMAAVMLTLNAFLIPTMSYRGAGMTFFIVNGLVVILDLFWIKKVIPFGWRDVAEDLTKIVLASIIMITLTAWLSSRINLVAVVVASAGVYFTLLYGLRVIDLKDLRHIKQI